MELRLKDEFQLNKFCLTFDDPEAFGSSQWRWPRPVFVVYRLLAASYVIGWNIYGYVTIPTFGHHVTIVFYTNWSYLVLALHLTLALLVTLYHSARRKKNPPEVRVEGSTAQAQTRPGSHVITICGGACAELPGNVLHYHLQECGHIEQSNLNAAGKRKQRTLGQNNNEYKAEEERGSRCRGGIGGGGDARRCNGPVALPSSGGKQRSKGKSRGHDHQGLKEGKIRTKRRCKSVGVNCTDIGQEPESLDELEGNRSNAVQSHNPAHNQQLRLVRTKPDGAPPPVVMAVNDRQKGRGRKSSSHHPEVYSREKANESPVDNRSLQPSGTERNQKRRKHSKVCHRRGKAVAFRCKSSNSSLDKIRARTGRRLAPDVKRRGRRSHRDGGRVEGPPASGSAGTRTAELSVAGGRCRATWQTDVDRGDKEGGHADPVASYRRDASWSRSHHRRGRSKTHSRSLSGPGAAGVEWVEEEVDGTGAHQTRLPATGSENRRLRSKPKGKHTFILQRSGGAARKLTMCGDRGIHAAAKVPSAAEPEAVGGSPATRSVGTNTSQAEVPQRISVIVENPAALPPTMEVVTPSTTAMTVDRRRSPPELPFYLKVSWVVFNMAAASAPVVSCVYFFVLFPMLKREQPSFRANILDINLHGINSLIVLLEVILSAFPVRILHCVYPLAYGLSYVIFSVAYWALDKQNNVLYPVILDWNNPAVTAPVVVGLVGLATPVLQLLWYGVYRLRLWVYNRLYNVQTHTSSSSVTQEAPTSNRKETQV